MLFRCVVTEHIHACTLNHTYTVLLLKLFTVGIFSLHILMYPSVFLPYELSAHQTRVSCRIIVISLLEFFTSLGISVSVAQGTSLVFPYPLSPSAALTHD